jgi:hypothetical protein
MSAENRALAICNSLGVPGPDRTATGLSRGNPQTETVFQPLRAINDIASPS